jgi:hypothetical protein
MEETYGESDETSTTNNRLSNQYLADFPTDSRNNGMVKHGGGFSPFPNPPSCKLRQARTEDDHGARPQSS